MINSIRIKNFKCFEDTEIAFENVNVLTGLNGVGKSTVIQAILLLRQSFLDYEFKDGLYLNGNYINLGLGKDVLYEKSDFDEGIFYALKSNNKNYVFDFLYDPGLDILPFRSKGIIEGLSDLSVFNKNFVYLSALRIAPQNFYKMQNRNEINNKNFGINGEYAIQYLKTNGPLPVKNKAVIIGDEEDTNLKNQTRLWLNSISYGANALVELNQLLNISELRYEFIEGKEKTNGYKSINVGFGLTYVLPVIVALLSSEKEDLIIIENPEAHIHPAGQRKLGELIAKAGAGGAQIIIETHSDHILNGIRLSVKKGDIYKDKVKLKFFYKDDKDDYKHKIAEPKIDENGKLDIWPDGFFDEWDKVLFELL